MKKALAIILSFIMILSSFTISVSSSNFEQSTIGLSGWSGFNGYYSIEQNTVTVANNNNRNNFFLSPADKQIKSFVLEADVTTNASLSTTAPPAVGLAFGVTDPDIINKTATGWPNDFFALHILFNKNNNAENPTLNIFKAGGNTFGTSVINEYKDTNRLKLVMDGNTAYVYINGVMLYSTTVTGYSGGQIGLCTYNATATFSNISFINLEGVKPSADMNWTVNSTIYEKAKYSFNSSGDLTLDFVDNWNNFLTTDDIKVTDSFILEADLTATLNNLTGAGFILGVNEQKIESDIWASEHLAVKIEHDTSQVRIHNLGIDEYYDLENFDPAAKNNLRVVVNGANVKVYVNSVLITDFDCNELVSRTYKAIGFNAYDTKAVYSNIKYVNIVRETVDGSWYGLSSKSTFNNVAQEKIKLKSNAGNNYLVSSNNLRSFTMEATVSHTTQSAGFLFGAQTNNCNGLSKNWYAVHLNGDSVRLFNEANYNAEGGLNIKKSVSGLGTQKKLRLVVEGNRIRVYVNNQLQIDTVDTQYLGGYVGVCNYYTDTTFTNFTVINDGGTFATNLDDFNKQSGKWEYANGYAGTCLNAEAAYNTSGYNLNKGEDFSVSADIVFEDVTSKAGIIFDVKNVNSPSDSYCYAYVDAEKSLAGILTYKNGETQVKEAQINKAESYTLKLECVDGIATLYINNIEIVKTDIITDGGYIGLAVSKGKAIFNKVYSYSLEPTVLTSLSLVGADMNMEFDPATEIYTASVDNDVNSVTVKATGPSRCIVTIGGTAAEEKTVNLTVGYNKIAVAVTNTETAEKVTYYVIVRRESDYETIYKEETRAKLHFSAQVKYMNDPNGLVYNAYRDEYHLYYQYSPYNMGHGLKSWGHAVSKDLVNWEEKPIAIYDDKNGSKWSGSAVIDKNNTTGFFDESTHPDDRMVLIITDWIDGEGAFTSIAYSTDGGYTYKYYNDGKPVLRAQDAKVVWHEETSMWLLIPTSGIIYSSPDLKNWTNSGRTYQQNGAAFPWWECQDLYPLKVEGEDTEKWVYNAAGSWYAVGRLVHNNGTYNFYAETPAQLYNGESNQEKDKTLSNGYFFEQSGDQSLYATQSFYNDKYGRRLTIGWVRETTTTNTWQGYQTLTYEQKLVRTDSGYTLYSYPVKELENQREELIYKTENAVVNENTNILSNTKGRLYDISAVITLGTNSSKVGFTLRDNGTNYIKVYYDADEELLVVDKSNSGSIYTKTASMPMSKLNGDKIKLRIIVDDAVLEIFGNDGEAPIVSLAYPKVSEGMSFFAEGDSVTVNNMEIYSMRSIWEKENSLLGDIDRNGKVETSDLAALKLYLAGVGQEESVDKKAADLDGDGKIGTSDLAVLKLYLAGATNI
ncbi:MAG: GH32 C-terminal domain-containing protein [Acutalibacteraceae bacterium]|nr:GH32 C-terminal domain-containing protein [Acutalibacteraceae bacterium]